MVLDVLIVILLVAGIVVGFTRGLIQPLLIEVGFFGTLIVLFVFRDAYSALLGHLLGGPVLAVTVALVLAVLLGFGGARLGGVLRKRREIRGIDGLLGVIVHVVIVLLVAYAGISFLVTLDHAFSVIADASKVTQAQIDQLSSTIRGNPLALAVVGQRTLDELRGQTSLSPQVRQLMDIYRNLLRDQLVGSHLAGPVVAVCSHIPFLGQVKPGDLPHR